MSKIPKTSCTEDFRDMKQWGFSYTADGNANWHLTENPSDSFLNSAYTYMFTYTCTTQRFQS